MSLFDFASVSLYRAPVNYGERLRAARRYAKLTQDALSNAVTALVHADNISSEDRKLISQPGISQLESSKTATASKFTAQFAHACGVNAMWLAEEIGNMIDTYSADPRIMHAAKVMEKLPEPIKSKALREVDELAELARELGRKAS